MDPEWVQDFAPESKEAIEVDSDDNASARWFLKFARREVVSSLSDFAV